MIFMDMHDPHLGTTVLPFTTMVSELDTKGQVSQRLDPHGSVAPCPLSNINCLVDDRRPPSLGATRYV